LIKNVLDSRASGCDFWVRSGRPGLQAVWQVLHADAFLRIAGAMFMDVCLSNVGRATAQHIISLQKTMRVDLGTYSEPNPPTDNLRRAESMPSLALGATHADLGKFHSALRTPAGVEGEEEEQVSREGFDKYAASRQIMEARRKREQTRNSSAFKAPTREALVKFAERTKSEIPPVGAYTPKDDCTAALSRVKHPPSKVASFGLREQTRSLKAKQLESEIRRLKAEGRPYEHLLHGDTGRELPTTLGDNKLAERRQIVLADLGKQVPRPDIIKAANLTYHDPAAISSRGLEEAHKNCAKFGKFYRLPCHSISHTAKPKDKPPDTYSQPGELKVKLDVVKPKLGGGNLSFEKRPDRRDIFEGSERPGDHLPDRSLARGNKNLTQFSRMKSPAMPVPDFNKSLSRKL